MEHKIIDKNKYIINLIKTNRFKTIVVRLTFINNFSEEFIINVPILQKLLVTKSKKYNTNVKLVKELEKLYLPNISSSSNLYGNYFLMNFSLELINPKYTEHSMYDKSFKIFSELLLKPVADEYGFDKNIFNIDKKTVISSIERAGENGTILAENIYDKNMFKGTNYEFTTYNMLDKIKKVNNKKLYNFYKEILNNSKVIITVLGDFDENIIVKNIEKLMNKIKTNNKLGDLRLKEIPTKKVNVIKLEKDFYQSTLLVGYKFYNLTDYEKHYVLPIYNMILGSMNNSILFVNVREKNSLCYSVISYIHKMVPALTIECGISSRNYEKALNVIKKSVNLMSNKNEIEKLYKNAINTVNLSLNDIYDNASRIIDSYVYREFDNKDSIEEKREKYNNVTVKDIIFLNKKMELNTILFMEGKDETN